MAQPDALSTILGNRLFQLSAILLSILALPIEAITIYRTGQEVLINENSIREGSSTAVNAEEITKINTNKIEQSAAEAAKMKADADSAELMVEVNRNKVAQAKNDLTSKQQGLLLLQDIERRDRRAGNIH